VFESWGGHGWVDVEHTRRLMSFLTGPETGLNYSLHNCAAFPNMGEDFMLLPRERLTRRRLEPCSHEALRLGRRSELARQRAARHRKTA
jgi:hypothetical protein